MILRDNYHAVQRFLSYRKDVLQLDPGTVSITWVACRHLLEWADSRPLELVANIRPTFPEYMSTRPGKDAGDVVTPKYQVKMCENVRFFFKWAKAYDGPRWKGIDDPWIDTIKVRRSRGSQSVLKKREYWTLDSALKLAAFQPRSLREERSRAAICFLYLSGMRATAFTTLPVGCVDISRRRIEQLPDKGVLTKLRKAAITFLLPIPELLAVVTQWDAKVRAAGCSVWYAPISARADKLSASPGRLGGRRASLWNDFFDICNAADVPYLSAHKMRHGHAVYGMQHAQTMEQLKALSQNLMHANLGITDGLYGVLPSDIVGNVVSGLTHSPTGTQQAKPAMSTDSPLPNNMSDESLNILAQKLMAMMQQNKGE